MEDVFSFPLTNYELLLNEPFFEVYSINHIDICYWESIIFCGIYVLLPCDSVIQQTQSYYAKIVNDQQCNFIPGRQGIENVVIVQELVHVMKQKRGRKGWTTVKLDLEKAYDRISWSFLRSVLDAVRFESSLIELIYVLC